MENAIPTVTTPSVHSSLKTYTSEKLTVLGECEVTVEYNGQTKLLPIAIVSGDGPSLLGRNWLEQLRLDWHRIANVSRNDQLEDLLTEYHEIFKDELGTVRNRQATFHLKEGATPKFFRSRSIPFAIKEAVGRELDQLEAAGIIEKVSHAEWAAPIVAVPKTGAYLGGAEGGIGPPPTSLSRPPLGSILIKTQKKLITQLPFLVSYSKWLLFLL